MPTSRKGGGGIRRRDRQRDHEKRIYLLVSGGIRQRDLDLRENGWGGWRAGRRERRVRGSPEAGLGALSGLELETALNGRAFCNPRVPYFRYETLHLKDFAALHGRAPRPCIGASTVEGLAA